MPINIVGNKITIKKEQISIPEVKNNTKFAIEKKLKKEYPETGIFLLVDGKIKKISPKSRYLLDMLTFEEN
jgi:hypothetical protein